ncbi:hypothetical protein EON65_15575 [archaeon]|nr:MAG: hypothetical protein EON65_15575 [archaeon]
MQAEEQLLFGHNVLPELHTGQDFYGLYIITLLLANNLNEAKYLWKRAPQEVKSPNGISQMGSAWEIGKAIWNHNTKQALHVMSTTQWHASLKPSVDKLYQEVISKECFLLHQSLQSILTTPLVESRLGISATDINTGNELAY